MTVFNKGVYVALVTPFTTNDDIDWKSLEILLRFHKFHNTTGIILLGTTGESPTLSEDEKKQIVKFVSKNISDMGLIVGVGGNNTKQVVEFTKYCNQYAQGLMVTVPNYNKPTQEGIYQHFKKISESTKLPIMMYNIPSRCGINMNYETVIKLYNDCNNISAIKEASGSLSQIQDIMNNCDIKVYAGDDSQLVPVMALGGYGVISVYANLNPAKVLICLDYCIQNNYPMAQKTYFEYHNKVKELFVKSNPINVKELLFSEKIITNKDCRLPLL